MESLKLSICLLLHYLSFKTVPISVIIIPLLGNAIFQ